MIHSSFAATAQQIPHRNHCQIGNAGFCRPDKIPRDVLPRAVIIIQICFGVLSRPVVHAIIPCLCRIVVVSSCIYDAVFLIAMRQIKVCITGIKSKLQDFHPRISCLVHQIKNFLIQSSKIFRDHIHISQCFFHRPEQIDARTFLPFSFQCIFCVRRNRIILCKSTKMIDAHGIV